MRRVRSPELSPESCESIRACRRLRNQIEHFAFTLKKKEAQGIIGRLLSLIFDFSKRHLELDLEAEFRRDHRWKALIDMVDFVEAHRKPIEQRLQESKTNVMECSACGALTFVVKDRQCSLCDHQEELFECEHCHGQFKESEVASVDAEEYGSIVLCEGCQGIGEPDYDYELDEDR